MKTMNLLERYAKEKIEAIQDRFKGRIERALNHEQNECEKYYRALRKMLAGRLHGGLK